MEIYFYQAECGDAARVTYEGTDGKNHHVFIDAGYERTFGHVLKEAIKECEHIDLWVVSHIHDDHIGGVISYLDALQRKEISVQVSEWLYNPPRVSLAGASAALAASEIKSIGQGDALCQYLLKTGKQSAQDITSNTPAKDLHGLKFQILSPSTEKLEKLRAKYANPFVPMEKEEDMKISSAKGLAKAYDYATKIADFDLERWKEDGNPDNGSSITFLTDLNGFKVLWLADAHPRDVVSGLKKLGYSSAAPLVCDWVKVTHHGSKGNNNNELYEMVSCSNYLFSVNGENIHYLPNKESMARILRNKNRNISKQRYKFYFTYDNPTMRSIFKSDGEEIFSDWNFEVIYPKGKWIKVPVT